MHKLASLSFLPASTLPVTHSCFLPKADALALGDAYEEVFTKYTDQTWYADGPYKGNQMLGHFVISAADLKKKDFLKVRLHSILG